jgi:predicted PurR-regulated permease PerM
LCIYYFYIFRTSWRCRRLALRTLLQGLQKIVKVRWLAVLLLIALIAGFLIFLALVIIPSLLKEARTLLSALPVYLDSLMTLSQKWHQQVSFVPNLSQVLVQLRSFIYQIIGSFPLVLQQAFGITLQAVGNLILGIYIAYYPDAIVRGLLRYLGDSNFAVISKIGLTRNFSVQPSVVIGDITVKNSTSGR